MSAYLHGGSKVPQTAVGWGKDRAVAGVVASKPESVPTPQSAKAGLGAEVGPTE